MEYLDIYNENGEFLGKEERSVVHRDALWHNTVHCWLYDKTGNVYFQIRKDRKTLYTTASGHVMSGETIKQGFGREISEELGINIDYEKAELVDVEKFSIDLTKKDGTLFKDRAFSNIYYYNFSGRDTDFNFDENELDGLVKVNAKEALILLQNGTGTIKGTYITKKGSEKIIEEKEVHFNDFLVNKGEIATDKYGKILNKVIGVVE